MFKKRTTLSGLINPREWQRIQDSLADTFDVTLRTFSPEGKLLTKESRHTRLCSHLKPGKTSTNHNIYYQCVLESDIKSVLGIKKTTGFPCHFGMQTFVIPIRASGYSIFAYIVLGPVIPGVRKGPEEYVKEAKKMDIPTDELLDMLIEINAFSHTLS